MANIVGQEIVYSSHYSNLQLFETVWATVNIEVSIQYYSNTTFQVVLNRFRKINFSLSTRVH